MKSSNFPWAIIAGAAIAGAGLAGIATYISTHDNMSPVAQENEQPAIVISNNSPQATLNHAANNEAVNQEQNRVSKTDALNKALKDNHYSEFRVLNVSVEEGNAFVDMNKELLSGMGSGAEADFIDLLKKTLAQYPDVKTFQIRIDGEIQKSLSHFEMLDPVPVR